MRFNWLPLAGWGFGAVFGIPVAVQNHLMTKRWVLQQGALLLFFILIGFGIGWIQKHEEDKRHKLLDDLFSASRSERNP